MTIDDVHGSLSEAIAGTLPRPGPTDRVIVDSTGTALQDQLLEPYSRPPADLDATGLRPADADVPDIALVCGLGIFVLAEVFAHGVGLREDVDATI